MSPPPTLANVGGNTPEASRLVQRTTVLNILCLTYVKYTNYLLTYRQMGSRLHSSAAVRSPLG